METLRDVFDSIRLHLRTRLANPLYAAYGLTWAAINFRLLLVLFGDGGWREKVDYIDKVLYPGNGYWAWYGVVYPLLVSIALVFSAPFLQRWVTVFTRAREKVTIEQLLKVAQETPLGPDAADALRKSLMAERQKRVEIERALRAEIEELNAQLEQAAKTADRESARPTPTDLEPGEFAIENSRQDTRLRLYESDFTSGGAYVAQLVKHGLTLTQARALFSIRNEDAFERGQLAYIMKAQDQFKASVAFDQLLELRLIQELPNEEYSISSLGRQTLGALMDRGFKGA